MHHQNVHKSYMKAAKAASECPETEMSGEEALVADQVDLGGDAAAGEHAENAALPENLDALCKEHICPQCDVKTEADEQRLRAAAEMENFKKRLALCVPLLLVGAFVGHLDYSIVWRYFSWTNQTLAMIVLWTASMYLYQQKKNYWITAVPATFMSAVSATYFLLGDECLGQLINSKDASGATIYNTTVAYPVGILFAVLLLAIFIHATRKQPVNKK